MTTKRKPRTHDAYVAAVARLAARHTEAKADDKATIRKVRLVWGDGPDNTLGITRYNKWRGADGGVSHWCAVCATAHPSTPHLIAETVLHELGHAVVGPGFGHGPEWKAACARLGLVDAKATYQHGDTPTFSAWMLAQLQRLPVPNEGVTVDRPIITGLPIPPAGPIPIRPCGAGKGVKGGKSYGANRHDLYLCGCPKGPRIRSAKPLRARCLDCGQVFARP